MEHADDLRAQRIELHQPTVHEHLRSVAGGDPRDQANELGAPQCARATGNMAVETEIADVPLAPLEFVLELSHRVWIERSGAQFFDEWPQRSAVLRFGHERAARARLL